jgi:tetratricopeptide (TPR) repeat protein
MKGDVFVRLGLEENFQKVQNNQILNEFDTILTGETGEAVLKIDDKIFLNIKNRTVIDIIDLRKIQENELFLFIMSQKINKLEPVEHQKIEVGNVSIIHGDKKEENEMHKKDLKDDWYQLEMNGAQVLYDYGYYANAIIKFYKIENKYEDKFNDGECQYRLAKSFEAENYKSQAIEAYQKALDIFKKCTDDSRKPEWLDDARHSLKKLKENK